MQPRDWLGATDPNVAVKVTAEDIAQLLASAPPRRVPSSVARAATGNRSSWFLPLFGLVFGGMGLVFTLVFFPWRFRDDWRLAADSARTVPGVITDVSRTNLSLNKVRVMAYGFRYTPGDGRRRQGRCFTTGTRWAGHASVTVRYLPDEPDLACVDGARLSESGGGGAFVALFPLIGGGLVGWFVLDRRRVHRLLRDGLMAEADVISVDETSARVNNQNVYRIVIKAPALQGGQPLTVHRVNKPDVNLALKHFGEKQPIFVLYDLRHPKRVLFPEALITDEAQPNSGK